MRTHWAAAASSTALLLLAACATIPRHTTPRPPLPPTVWQPAHPPDISRIPDAVPHWEPRSALGNPPFYDVDGHRYVVLPSASGYVQRGVASWYGPQFHGLRTATGEPYDMFAMSAAHKTLPLPCYARVTNLENGRSVVVRINDRGPFVANRIIDLSYSAAVKLGMIRTGTAFVQVQTLTPPPSGPLAVAWATPRAAGAGELFIQVGAFARLSNARRAAQRLRDAGLQQVFVLSADPHQPLLRVRIGPLDSVQQFDALIGRLQALGFGDARLAQD